MMYRLLFACLLLSSGLFAQQQIDRVVALVGNEPILVSDIEAQYRLLLSRTKEAPPENARAVILDQLLTNAVVLAEAERDSFTVSAVEIEGQLDSRISEILRYMNNDPEQFKAYYGKTPEEVKNDMRESMRKQMVVQRMSANIMQSVTVTPKEVQTFFNKIPEDSLPYFNSTVELAQIVIKPKVNEKEDERARQEAERIRQEILNGADFAELAKQYSQDPGSGARGGDLGITNRGSFVPEFEATAYQLDENEISELVKSQYGYHIIQLLERLGNNIHTRHILIKAELTPADEERAKNEADSIRSLILLDSFTFDQAVQRFSEDEFSKTRNGAMMNPQTGEPYWELGDLSPEVYFAIEKLKKGEISEAIEYSTPFGEKEYTLIKIRNRTIPHVANLQDDYSRIQMAAKEEKKSRYIQEWVAKKIDDHYVEFKFQSLGSYADFFIQKNGQAKNPQLQRWMMEP